MPTSTVHIRIFYMPQISRHGTHGFRIFPPLKIRRLRPGLNPRTWVPEASTLTPRPPKPLLFNLTCTELQTIEVLHLFTPVTLYFHLWLENLIRSCSNSFLRCAVLIFLLDLVHDKVAYESCWHTCGMWVVLSLVLQQQEVCSRFPQFFVLTLHLIFLI
jgi:hypothetical protein